MRPAVGVMMSSQDPAVLNCRRRAGLVKAAGPSRPLARSGGGVYPAQMANNEVLSARFAQGRSEAQALVLAQDRAGEPRLYEARPSDWTEEQIPRFRDG